MVLDAHWEHGYRVHGLWLNSGNVRLGRVGIGPRPWDGIYHWSIDSHVTKQADGSPIEGSCKSLRTAKRTVERIISERTARCGE